jgi:hypothetical protein
MITKLYLTALVLMLGTGLACAQEEKGWFSGISALPYTNFLGSGDGLSVENSDTLKKRSNLIGGEGAVPIGKRWNMLGRLGTASSAHPWLFGVSGSMDSVMPYDQMGLGLSYNLGENVLLQGNLDRYQLKYNRINGDNGVDLLTLGLKYRF